MQVEFAGKFRKKKCFDFALKDWDKKKEQSPKVQKVKNVPAEDIFVLYWIDTIKWKVSERG